LLLELGIRGIVPHHRARLGVFWLPLQKEQWLVVLLLLRRGSWRVEVCVVTAVAMHRFRHNALWWWNSA